MKKTIFSIMFLLILLCVPTIVLAANDVAKVGETLYATLEEALDAAMETGEEVTLLQNAELANTYKVADDLTINLAGFEIAGASSVFEVEGAEFTVRGEGTLKETAPDLAVIFVRGSENSADENYSVVNIENGVTLEGWAGIMVKGHTNTSVNSYGVVINCNDTIINSTLDQANGTGHGIYINGYVKNQQNPVKVNVASTTITSEGTGMYAAGYGVWNFTDTTINAHEMGLGIKSGTIVLNNVDIYADSVFAEPEGNGNGITPTGAAIQIEEHKSYAGKIHLIINGGTFTSKNNSAILEYTTSVNGVTFVEEIEINDGTFSSAERKQDITVSNSFSQTITEGFIKGGTFSSDVQGYVAPYHVCEPSGSNYVVKKLHDITVTSSEGGKANSVLIRAKEGTNVGLEILADEGYEFRELIVTDVSGVELFRTYNQYFIMPDSEVIVKAIFGKLIPKVETSDSLEYTPEVDSIIKDSLIKEEMFDKVMNNNNVQLKVEVTEGKVDETKKEEIEKALKENEKVAKYIDITIAIKDKDTGTVLHTLDELTEEITFTVEIPEDLLEQEVEEGFARKYYIIRNHNGIIEYLDAVLSEDGKTLSFKTNKFSAYALAYEDVKTTGEGDAIVEDDKSDETTDDSAEVPKEEQPKVEESKNIPNTGDNIILYLILAVIAVAGIIIMKKSNNTKSKH